MGLSINGFNGNIQRPETTGTIAKQEAAPSIFSSSAETAGTIASTAPASAASTSNTSSFSISSGSCFA